MNATEAENMLAQLQKGRSKDARQEPTELDDLDLRVVESVTWCMFYSDVRHVQRCLRRPHLAPPPLAKSRHDAVERVISSRRYWLKQLDGVTLPNVAGQLLVYFPDANLGDGKSQTESKDFFDFHNAPPWGTWIGYFEDQAPEPNYRSYVLAWVPQVFLELAQKGVDANREKCLAWLTKTPLVVQHILKHARFGRTLA